MSDTASPEAPGGQEGSAQAQPRVQSKPKRSSGLRRAWRRRPPPLAAPPALKVDRPPPGSPAGIEYHELVHTPGAEPARVVCTDYCPERQEAQEVSDIAAFLAVHRPAWSQVRWIHVEGLQDRAVIRALAEKYQLHPLAIEDALEGYQRPKAEDYPAIGDNPGRLFVVARRVRIEDSAPAAEQISFFLGRNTLLSFEQTRCMAIEEVRQRIANPRSRLRGNDASFLLYSLLDTIVDRFFPTIDEISGRLEAVEELVLDRPHPDTLQSLHRIKRDLAKIRRVAWPMRELIGALQRERHECLSEIAQTYFRDVQDHCVQIIDLIETYRETANAVADTYVSLIANRTNDIMKVLTIIGTIFIPLTFIAGVYGMNMDIPENRWPYSYPVFWAVCLGIAGFMLWRFRRGGWL